METQTQESDRWKDHQIIENGENDWIWKRPNTITYWMEFIVRKDRLIIIGDCYDWIFGRSDAKSLLLSANNKEYFWEKRSTAEEVFSEKETKKFLIEAIEERYNVEEDEEIKELGTLKELIAKIKKQYWFFDREVIEFIEYEFPSLEMPEEYVVRSWPGKFNLMWEGLQAFRKQYWKEHLEK